MGKPKRGNDLALDIVELKRTVGNFQTLVENCTVADNDNLLKCNIELKGIHKLLKSIDAQNKALFRLYGVLYKMLDEPEKPHDKFELFDDSKSSTSQSGSIHDHPA